METTQVFGPVFFLRHGQTNYTNIFPDVTEEGEHSLKTTAREIKNVINGRHAYAAVVASPATRALGSASIIAKGLQYRGRVRTEPDIKEAGVRDKVRGMALFNEYMKRGDSRGLAVAYSTEHYYEDPSIFEPRSEVNARFYHYLARVVRRMLFCRPGFCLVNVSHYETLYHFVENVFKLDYKKDRPLSFAEMFYMVFYETEYDNVVEIVTTFRGLTIGGVFFDHEGAKLVEL